ncbi:MAG: alpha/beta hydrolase fold domain-containing protein, partial [Planctomycetaceae bacterium]
MLVRSRCRPLIVGLLLVALNQTPGLQARPIQTAAPKTATRKQAKKRPAFRWVNPLPDGKYEGVAHRTFRSPSMKRDVGYCIYLPPGYAAQVARRYPVVYYLHGGRPGNETKSVGLAEFIHAAMAGESLPPMIYVFVNGGAVSHYNYPAKDSLGEDVFVRELIPHVDATYRTVPRREARAIEGFSQGGRGTTRIMFKHPHLFCSAAPGGAGHATEKRISEQDGRESDQLRFATGDNTYDLARRFAAHPHPPLKILVHVGTRGFNYENNLAYMRFLDSLDIAYQKLIVPDVPHSARKIYEKNGLDIMRFHAENFRYAGPWTPAAPRKPRAKKRSGLPSDVRVLRDLEYARVGDRSLKLDLYRPAGQHDRSPLVVWIHGGAWKSGSKNKCGITWMVNHGYAVASVDYRLSGEAVFPALVHDCKAAIRWLRAHAAEYGFSADRMGVAGASAGGHLAALVGLSSDVAELEGEVGTETGISSRVHAVL